MTKLLKTLHNYVPKPSYSHVYNQKNVQVHIILPVNK